MKQMVKSATRSVTRNGVCTETCSDLIFNNVPQQCSNACVFPVGWSDHNMVYITGNTKIPKRPPGVIVKRSFNKFSCEEFKRDLAVVPWELIYLEDNLAHASERFTEFLAEMMSRHAPIRKRTVKDCCAPWID